MIGTLGQFVREIRDKLAGSGDPIPVDIGSNIEVTVDNTSIEVSNDEGNPIPISDAGGSLTVDAASWPLPTGAATAANQATLIGHVDGVEALLTTIDVDTGSIDGKLPALVGGRLPVDIGSLSLGQVEISNDTGNPIPVSDNAGSLTVDTVAYGPSSASITRPANTTAYIAGDVVSNSTSAPTVLEFTSIGPSGGRVVLQSASLRIDVAAVPSGMGSFRLHLYTSSPTAINDNAAFNLPSGDRTKYAGYIEFSTPQDLGDTLWSQAEYIGRQIKLDAASTSLYGILETRGAFTPSSAAVKTIKISALEAGR